MLYKIEIIICKIMNTLIEILNKKLLYHISKLWSVNKFGIKGEFSTLCVACVLFQ